MCRVSKWRPGVVKLTVPILTTLGARVVTLGRHSCQKLDQITFRQIWVVMMRTFWLSLLTTLTTFWLTSKKLSCWQHICRLLDNLPFCVKKSITNHGSLLTQKLCIAFDNMKSYVWKQRFSHAIKRGMKSDLQSCSWSRETLQGGVFCSPLPSKFGPPLPAP